MHFMIIIVIIVVIVKVTTIVITQSIIAISIVIIINNKNTSRVEQVPHFISPSLPVQANISCYHKGHCRGGGILR